MGAPFVLNALAGSRRWTLHPPFDPYGDGYTWSFRTEISDEGMSAETTATVLAHTDLGEFFQGLADDWRGWSGVRTWNALEGEMKLDASHDGRGHVSLGVTLWRSRQTYEDDAWCARVVFTIEAGEEMTRLARDIRHHLEKSDRPV